jgi:hypothetical protein
MNELAALVKALEDADHQATLKHAEKIAAYRRLADELESFAENTMDETRRNEFIPFTAADIRAEADRLEAKYP